MSREVMQMALSALKHLCMHTSAIKGYDGKQVQTACDALRACLAQPEQYDQTELELCKKCGWKAVWPDGCLVCEKQKAQLKHWSDCAVHSEPAYPAGECDCGGVQPEPVVWHEPGAYGNVTIYEKWAKENGWLPLYTTPQKKEWVGLTDDDVNYAAEAVFKGFDMKPRNGTEIEHVERVIKFVETKLKEKNK